MGDCLLSNFDLAKLHFDRSNIIRNFKIIYARKFLSAVFSYCTFKLAIKKIDKSIIMFCLLSWFWDYPQRGTQGYRFGFSVVTSLFVVESIPRQWNIDISFIYLLPFRQDELDPKSNDKCSNTFRSFLMMN